MQVGTAKLTQPREATTWIGSIGLAGESNFQTEFLGDRPFLALQMIPGPSPGSVDTDFSLGAIGANEGAGYASWSQDSPNGENLNCFRFSV